MEKERQTTPAVCKVFVPAIVSKRLPTMRGPHAVIIPVSQGHDIVTVTLNDDEFFFLLSFNLYLVEFQQGVFLTCRMDFRLSVFGFGQQLKYLNIFYKSG